MCMDKECSYLYFIGVNENESEYPNSTNLIDEINNPIDEIKPIYLNKNMKYNIGARGF